LILDKRYFANTLLLFCDIIFVAIISSKICYVKEGWKVPYEITLGLELNCYSFNQSKAEFSWKLVNI